MARAIPTSASGRYRGKPAAVLPKRSTVARPGLAGLTAEWVSVAALGETDVQGWRDLVKRAIEPNVFLEPAFALAAARFDIGAGAVIVRAGSRLVGMMPGRMEGIGHGRLLPTFVSWVHPFAPLSTPLIDAEAAADVVELLLEALAALPGRPRLALLPLLDEEGAVAKLFLDRLVRTGRRPVRLGAHRRAALLPGNGNPFVALSVKKLKELRRQRWRLAEEGTLVREMVSHTSGINAVIADYLALEAKGWKGRWGGAAMHDAPSARLLSEAVASLAAEGKARIDLLKLDGRPIAATIALFSGDRAWFWKTAYDEDLARYSPGVQLALDLSEALGRYRHLKVVDSCAVAGHPMIDHLWEGRLALADWLVPLGGRPSFAAGVAAERVRRAVIAPLKAVRDRLRD